MRYSLAKLVVGAALVVSVGRADAQMTPGGMGPMGGMPGGGTQRPAGDDKKEGVAEAAPKTPGLLPTTPALPPPKGRRKRWKLLELGGYYRVRTDWFKNFNLGFNDDPTLGGAPFPRSTGCRATTILNHPCSDTLQSTNMRLRLEPTFYLDEGTSVHVQADALDNLLLGSTPLNTDYSATTGGTPMYTTTNRPPVGAFGSTQGNVVRGVNSASDSITVKRAWAEVALPLDGILKAGRMPDQWGLGMYHNAGGYDPINGTYNYDADYGDSVDRVSFSLAVPGTQLRAMVAVDWDLTRLTSNQTAANRGREGHPISLDDASKTNGWVGVVSKMEPAQEFRDAVDRGETMLDYGIYFEYKTQDWDQDPTGFSFGQTLDAQNHYVPRGLKTYTPDLWLKLGSGKFLFEAEFVAQIGSVSHLDDLGIVGSANIRKFGGIARGTWKGVEGKLKLGLESGFATGDQWDNTPQGNTNIAFANQLGDPTICNAQHTCTLTQFMFNRDYHIDLIFWRHLVTAVTNAAYVRPFLQYDLTKGLSFKVWNVTSFALRPVSTPGNGSIYGTEFDADIGYTTHRLFAGISAGVFFPFGAMAHPADQQDQGGAGYGYGTDPVTMTANTGDPGTAYAILSRLVLAF